MISLVVVASSGDFSVLYFPVNRGNLIASPAPGLIEFNPHVCIGLSVISAPITSNTKPGTNQVSATILESTLVWRWLILYFSNISGSFAKSSSLKPDPHLHAVLNTSSFSSYAAKRRAPYVPPRLPLPAKALTTTRSTVSCISDLYSRLYLIQPHPLAPALQIESGPIDFIINPSHPSATACCMKSSSCSGLVTMICRERSSFSLGRISFAKASRLRGNSS